MFGSVQSVHFVGICGTAMASVAAAMRERGFHVTGSDQNVYPPMSTFLAERGIDISHAAVQRWHAVLKRRELLYVSYILEARETARAAIEALLIEDYSPLLNSQQPHPLGYGLPKLAGLVGLQR